METVPGGNDKGKRWTEVSDNGLNWWAKNGKTQEVRDAAQSETQRRSGGGKQEVRAIVPVEQPKAMGRAMHDPLAVNEQLHELAARYHLVSPVARFDVLPEGFGVSFSMVQINPDPNGGEVYKVDGGKLALSHHALNRIASAAEVSWDPERSKRLDDGSDSCYCHFRAVGYVRVSDGTQRTVCGEVELDLRPGSAEASAQTDKQLNQTRRFILRHAESKAKNRAIASMGVKRSYTPEELQKPFAVTRLQFTGHSDDPYLRREFARIRAEQVMGASRALYGAGPAVAAASTDDDFAPHAPPPLDVDGEEYQADEEDGRY